jgi:hypothetical protein
MWQVADAKNKFSEILTRSGTEGPQGVRRRGRTCVVPAEADHEKLQDGTDRPRMTPAEFFMSGSSFEGLGLERRKSPMQSVDLE